MPVKTRVMKDIVNLGPQESHVYTRRIAAVVNVPTPSVERRIVTPFSAFHEAGILAGWAPYETLAALDDEALDAVVLPNPGADERQIDALRRVGRRLILDLDAPLAMDEREIATLHMTLGKVDAVTVPTELLATRLRPYHAGVFVIPHLIRAPLWRDFSRPAAPKPAVLRVGLPPVGSEPLELAVVQLEAKFGPRVVWERFNPYEIDAIDEPRVYGALDIVVVPPPPERSQVSLAPILPAQAAQCCVVADRLWPGIAHDRTGMQVGRDTMNAWLQTINRAIVDSRLRQVIGRNARHHVRRQTPEVRIQQIALPYRLVVPESGEIRYPSL